MNTKSFLHSPWLVLIAPLFAFPFMINLRIFPFIAPNEEPKWAILTVCALWMGLATTWLWAKRKTPLAITTPSLPALLLLTYLTILGIGIFIGPNMTEGMIRFSFWFFCAAIFAASAWAIRHKAKWQTVLVWSVSIGSAVFSLRYWESYFLDFDKPNYNIHVLFSPIGHVNFTGDVLIMLLPMLMWALVAKSNPTLRILNWFSVATIATILLVASSRGALGGIAVATTLTLLIIIKHYPSWSTLPSQKVTGLLLGSALLASVLTYNALPYHYRDLARVSATAGQATTDKGKIELSPDALQPPLVDMWVNFSPLLGARTPIFASTTAMTLDAPWLGQGTGNFPWVYPSYSNRYPDFRDPLSSTRTFTTNPHNVVLQIASQNGIPAMLIFMVLLLFFWWTLLRSLWKNLDGYTLAGFAAISAAMFDAMFNHVFFNPASMFVFALLGGSWWGYIVHTEKQQPKQLQPKIAATFILIAAITLSIYPARWLISEWYAGQAMVYVKYPSHEAKYYQKAYDWNPENFRAVFGMGQVAYKQKKYAESARYFSEFQQFYPYNPPALNMLGAAYMMNGNFLQAEQAFAQAVAVFPGFEMAEQNLQRARSLAQQQQFIPPIKP
ncbi:MAG: O-antigen ligase family protein [Ghiorsea sp.]|nr:O-antigen ligase family protein [Ghiorsea sp.]